MRRVLVPTILIILVLSLGQPTSTMTMDSQIPSLDSPLSEKTSLLADVAGIGRDRLAEFYTTRILTNRLENVLNSYASTDVHTSQLSLTDYQLSGWTLSNITIDVANITAAPEREVAGVQLENFDLQIIEFAGTFYSELSQGFYDQPHNGSLLNYSIFYSTEDYNPSIRGNASVG
ncbi:MAG: hypothetical protein ACXAEN_21910, partial [Candidatus Thorarchaeota archaeon]